MPVVDLTNALAVLAPNATPLCLECFSIAGEVLPRYEINNPLRVSHFLAQVLHETGGLTDADLVENLNYSAEGLHTTYRKYFPTLEEAKPFGRAPGDSPEVRRKKQEAIANRVYGGRKDLGNNQPGDGFRFIGRSLNQITGRWMYERIGSILGIDLVGQPWLACHPQHALEVTAALWTHVKKLNPFADEDDLLRVSIGINGVNRSTGLPNGFSDRAAWLVKVKGALHLGSPA